MRIVALFFPAFLSVGIHHHLLKIKENSRLGELFLYAAYMLAENLTSMIFISLVLGQYGVLEEALSSFPFFIKYTLISVVFALIFPVMAYMIKKNVRIFAGVEKHDNP